ncbi:hypothetical protein HY479_02610 [Candidatus Uhrbacteria bacterium]|nr:hypothetical protein [Candidatus Uhrbacteria bacterium]
MEIKSYSRYLLTVLCVAVVITTLVLVGLNAWLTQPSGLSLNGLGFNPDAERQAGYKEGYNAARDRLSTAGLCALPVESTVLTGSVMAVEQGLVIVVQESLDTDPLADGVPDERVVRIGPETKIFIQKEASPDELAAASATPDTAPIPVGRTAAKWTDIPTEGGRVRVSANEDIRLKEEFTAREIVILPVSS